MPIVNKIVPGIDLPTYEFLRPNFSNNQAQVVSFFSIPGGKNRFMYAWGENGDGIPYRYDTFSDSMQRLPATPQVSNTLASYAYLNKGYCGNVINASVSAINIGAQDANQSFVGKTIRITKGPGKNQERRILSVSDPIVVERMVLTAVTNNQGVNAGTVVFTDTLRSMSANQYMGHEAKIVFGTGYGQVRNILYNTNTAITLADPGLAGVVYNHSTFLPTSPAATSIVLIQYSTLTVDQPWTVLPTGDSQFEIIDSGGKLHIMYAASSPFAYYECDLNTQLWDYKTIYGIRTSTFATDYDICGGYPSDTPSVSATVTSASSLFFADSANPFAFNRFTNYQVKIQRGSGQGQIRHIVSSALSGYTIDLPWDVVPDQTSVYTINNNERIIYGIGGTTDSRLYNYHSEYDVWSHFAYVVDYGHVNTAYATSSAYEFPIPISTITRVGTVATATTTRSHMINFVNGTSLLTISGSTDPLYNGTFSVQRVDASATQFTYNMTGTPAANATFGFTNTTTRIFDATKAWTTNQWVSAICYIFNTQTTQFPAQRARLIASNDRNSLTLLGALDFTPSNGCRYFIFPLRPMGTDEMEGVSATKLTYGQVTVAGATTITDATKNWQTNIHVNKRCMIIAGTGAGTEATITANTATVLTCSITTDTTSVYVILGNLPLVNAGAILENAYNTTNNKGKYLYFNRGSTTPMFGQRYNISTQTWETHGYPTFYANAAQQNDGRWPYGASNGGQCSVYDGNDRIYFNVGGNQRRIFYLDLSNDQIYNAGIYPYANSNNGYTRTRHLGLLNVQDVKFVYMHRCGGTSDAYRFIPTY